MTTYTPAEAFPPGEYLRDELEERGWTASEFAEIINRPPQAVSEILNAKKEITPDTALELAAALGTSAELWLNLESAYRLHRARQGRNLSDVERRARLRGLVPLRELQQRRWLPTTDDLDELELATCTFLGVADLSQPPHLNAAARRSGLLQPFTSQQIAWTRRVLQRAQLARQVGVFDVDALAECAMRVPRELRDPTDLRLLAAKFAACGVRLVIELPLKGSKIDGVALWTDEGPVIGLSTRGDRLDGFVFTLLHEVAHVVRGHLGSGGVALDEDLDHGDHASDLEREANELAGRWIFPHGLEAPRPITARTILAAAREHDVAPALVVGRLHFQGDLDWKLQRKFIPKVRPFLPELQEDTP